MREILAELGQDAIFAADIDPKASDETLLALSAEQGRIVVTRRQGLRRPWYSYSDSPTFGNHQIRRSGLLGGSLTPWNT